MPPRAVIGGTKMTADNVVKFPRKRIAAFAHATGSGLSWSTRLGAGVGRSRSYFGGDAMRDRLERLDAELAVNEAEYRAMELAIAEAAAFEPHMTPQQAAELAVVRARLKVNRIDFHQCYRERRRIKAQLAWSLIKRLLVLAFLFWLLIKFAGAAQAQSTSRSFYSERGSFAGSSVTRDNSTSFYDGRGRFSGSAIRHGNSTSFYDRSGHYTGSVINTSPKR
jgi:hypothetical protein